jgi:hypothetical protein
LREFDPPMPQGGIQMRQDVEFDAQGGIVVLARTAISAKSPRTALRLTANR